MKNIPYVLIYIRNGEETLFPIETIDHAVRLADAIADSDLMNDDVEFNSFDVYHYQDGEIGELWEDEEGRDFTEFWRNLIEKQTN